jgi:hypothetical protein
MMRTEAAIRADLEAALAAHRAADHETLTVAEAARNGQAIKALQQELAATLVAGAVPCKGCGALPMAMLKTPSYQKPLDARAPDGPRLTVPAVYEVGCASGCTVMVPVAGGAPVAVRVMPGIESTAAGAVAAWNALQA